MSRWIQSFLGFAATAIAALAVLGAGLRRRTRASWRWVNRAPDYDSVTIGADLR